MPVLGAPVVVSTNGYGTPVRPVADKAPLLTVSTNGRGMPIVISDNGAPFVVDGYSPPVQLRIAVLSSDDGAPLVSESGKYLET